MNLFYYADMLFLSLLAICVVVVAVLAMCGIFLMVNFTYSELTGHSIYDVIKKIREEE